MDYNEFFAKWGESQVAKIISVDGNDISHGNVEIVSVEELYQAFRARFYHQLCEEFKPKDK